MAELAARIIGPKCSLPVVVLIHLDGGGGWGKSFRWEFVDYTLERSVVVHSKRKRAMCVGV